MAWSVSSELRRRGNRRYFENDYGDIVVVVDESRAECEKSVTRPKKTAEVEALFSPTLRLEEEEE